MTKPRTSVDREIIGILGKHPEASSLQRQCNAYFSKQGIDAFMARYPTTVKNLPERLSEMFHFDRRAYIVGPTLQKAILPLLDELDRKAAEEGRVTVIANKSGVLKGYYVEEDSVQFLYNMIEH